MSRETDRRVIWGNINLDLDDWRNDMREQLEMNGTEPEKIYSGTVTKADIDRVTRPIGTEIAKVYGFELPKEKQSAEMER